MWKKIEAIYQLKNTSDYSQNDPPGPEQNLRKKLKKSKKDPKLGTLFSCSALRSHIRGLAIELYLFLAVVFSNFAPLVTQTVCAILFY